MNVGSVKTSLKRKAKRYCHITGKFRAAAHWSCNVNLKLTKRVYVIFHGLKGYDCHLAMNKIDKFDVKVNVILNGLEKYMAFTITKSLVFYDSMYFIKNGIEKLVKTLSDSVFKYFLEEFNLEQLKLVK